jgi:hypothetical protein
VSSEEEPLAGGSLTGAVRLGGTVRKPAGPWTPAIHALLRHLDDVGFEGAPLSEGLDDRGRHVLSFMDGETVGDPSVMPWPSWCWAEDTLREAARWTRSFHDATAGFSWPEGSVWRFDPDDPGASGVCHHDLGPYNAVWRRGLAGFIDWDMAGPGDPRSDVAQVCRDFAPLLPSELADPLGASSDLDEQLRRTTLAFDLYGVDDRRPFVDLIVDGPRSKADRIRALAEHDPVFRRIWVDNADVLLRTRSYLDSIRGRLAEVLR